jgi:hypothetical protein
VIANDRGHFKITNGGEMKITRMTPYVLCLVLVLLVSCTKQVDIPTTQDYSTPLIASPTRLVLTQDTSSFLTQTANALLQATPTTSITTPEGTGCDGGFSRLAIGMTAVVSESELPLRVRMEPVLADDNILALLQPGASGEIIEGPVCTEGLIFWKIENDTIPEGSGWIAEGNGTDYWLEPSNP